MAHNNKANILLRFGLITAIFFLLATCIVGRLFYTTIIEGPAWNKEAKKELNKRDTIQPVRGKILADNGAILACNVSVYDIKVDMRHDRLKGKTISPDTLAALADSLDRYYPRTRNFERLKVNRDSFERYSWHTKLAHEFAKPDSMRTRSLRLVKDGSLEDFERLKRFPLFARYAEKTGFRNPLYVERKDKRIYPFGNMASLSIGRVSRTDKCDEVHGYSGLENALDEYLYGKPGIAKKLPLTKGLSNWFITDVRDGYDILSTINIDLQDMLERELLDVCREANASWGTAILMEVETGEIKALSNVEWIEERGEYGEAKNRAVEPFEPGSVVKTISMMIAFEDGLVHNVTDVVDCSPFMRTTDPHGSGMKNMKQVLEQSSNTGMARVIFRGYGKNPEKFHDRLASIGFFDEMQSGIKPSYKPIAHRLEEYQNGKRVSMESRHIDLARQAFGYNTQIPPLYTLAYYNAIANGGKFMVPHLVRGLRLPDGRDSLLQHKWRVDSVCSKQTANKVKQCLHEVVWGEHGTARLVQDDRVEIVGKTGTAFPVIFHQGYDKSRRRFAFCGFFPYDKPKYSCMVLIDAPGGNSANRTSGQVLKNVAVKMYARGMLDDAPKPTKVEASNSGSSPLFGATTQYDHKKVANGIDAATTRRVRTPKSTPVGTVPDVTGYDAASAINILESRRMNVRLEGSGIVVSQSVAPGTPLRRGATITLRLKV